MQNIFKVTYTTSVIVEFDTEVFTEEAMRVCSNHFYNIDTLAEHSKNIAGMMFRHECRDIISLRDGTEDAAFLPGYGYVLFDNVTADLFDMPQGLGKKWSGIRVRFNPVPSTLVEKEVD